MNLSYPLRLAGLVLSMAVVYNGDAQTINYYSKSSGALNLTSSWGTNTNGTGTAPTNFTGNNHIFNIRNQTNPTINASWTVSGTNSKIVVGDGSNASNFSIPSTLSYTGTVDVGNKGTLTIASTAIPTLGTLNANSTVVFNGTGNQTIPIATYGNLTCSGSNTCTMSGSTTIAGTLSITNSAGLDLNNTWWSTYSYNVGSFIVSNSATVDFGSLGFLGASTTMNLSGNYTQSGTGYIQTSGYEANGIIYFTGTAQTISQSASENVNYVVNSGSRVTLGLNFAMGGGAGLTGYTGTFTVNSGGTLDCGTYVFRNYSTYITTSMTINGGATLITAGTAGIASLGITGSIQLATSTFSSSANYIYDGSSAQITGLFTTTPAANTVNNLTIDNASGVILSQNLAVNGTLTLTSGILSTTTLTLMTVNNGATVTGASDNSFVDGPIAKIGNAAFTFPVGVTGVGYVPIGISAPSTTTSAFQAQYFHSSAKLLGLISIAGLDHVSQCDYWVLNRTSGTSTVNITGFWNANNACGGTYINDVPKVALAHFNGATWNAFGNDAVTGSTGSGSVTWNNVSNFSPFSLASTNTFNPLPMKLLGFDARWTSGGTVALSWQTAQEENTDHFMIQRSGDGVDWANIGSLAAAGSSSIELSYAYTDTDPLPGLNYYRFVLADKDGSLTYSEIKVVTGAGSNSIRIFPNPATDHLNIGFGTAQLSAVAGIRLMNASGQILQQKKVVNPAGETISLSVSGYPPGAYLLQILSADNIQESQVIVIK